MLQWQYSNCTDSSIYMLLFFLKKKRDDDDQGKLFYCTLLIHYRYAGSGMRRD